MEKNVIGVTQAQPIEPLIYFLSPRESSEGYSNSVCPSVSDVPMIDYSR